MKLTGLFCSPTSSVFFFLKDRPPPEFSPLPLPAPFPTCPPSPPPRAPVGAARSNPGRCRPAPLAPQAPAKLPDTAALARRARARDRALRDAERRNGRAAHLFGRHGAFGRQLRRDAAENGPLRLDRKRRRRLPAPQRRALEHHLRECERRPA